MNFLDLPIADLGAVAHGGLVGQPPFRNCLGQEKVRCMIRRHSHSSPALVSAVILFLLTTWGASPQEVGLVTLDAKEIGKGYRAEALKLRPVVNEKGETIGLIDDFIFGRGDCNVFAVLAVGDFIGSAGHLVAVPFHSLKLDDPSGSIMLPGASRAALQKLPVFLYNH
jgi:hypothetical protein